jgi:hypothetical protein
MSGSSAAAPLAGRRALFVLLAVAGALFIAAFGSSRVHADEKDYGRSIYLTDGSTINDFCWFDRTNLLLYAVNPHGGILWKHDVNTNTRTKLLSATAIDEMLPKGFSPADVKIAVSSDHKYLAVRAEAPSPNVKPFFRVLSVGDENKPEQVYFAGFPSDFWVGAFAWDPSAPYLYIAQTPYTNPQISESIGRLSVKNQSYIGLASKKDVDLVERLLVPEDGRDLLIVSWSYKGDYPRDRYLLDLDVTSDKVTPLASIPFVEDASVSADGKSLIYTLSTRDTNGSGDVNEADESAVSRLTIASRTNDVLFKYSGFNMLPKESPDGKWIGFLRIYRQLDHAPTASDPRDLWVYFPATGDEILVMRGVSDYTFTPDGTRILALDSKRLAFNIYSLP